MPEKTPLQNTRRWKRTAAVALLLLVGGAVVNVAVAWGIAVFVGTVAINPGKWRVIPKDEALAYWISEAPAEWHENLRHHGSAAHKWAFGREVVIVGADDPSSVLSPLSSASQRAWSITHFSSGWPALSMHARTHRLRNGNTISNSTIVGWPLVRNGREIGTLPTRLRPAGFVLNTLFYATLLWLLCVGPLAIRRRRRAFRGLCAKCAYPVGVSPVCTECGAAVARKTDA